MIEKLNENIQGFTAIGALLMLFLALYNGMMFMASSHGINIHDDTQLKFLLGLIVYAIGAIIYFRNIEKLNRFNFQVFVLNIPVIISIYDQIKEIGNESEFPVSMIFLIIFLFYFIILGLNVLLLISQVFFLFKS